MHIANEINNAIAAHGEWKYRLRDALEQRGPALNLETVRADDCCEFGRWLYALPPYEQASRHWKMVRSLHAEFHRVAATVLSLALSGQRAEVEAMLSFRGEFTRVSAQLTRAMVVWRANEVLSS